MRSWVGLFILCLSLAGCMSSPSEFYGIRQAVPEQATVHAAATSHAAPLTVAKTNSKDNVVVPAR